MEKHFAVNQYSPLQKCLEPVKITVWDLIPFSQFVQIWGEKACAFLYKWYARYKWHPWHAGATGPTGTNGTNGTAGATGPTGDQGNPGTAGTPGTNGTPGATGPTGSANAVEIGAFFGMPAGPSNTVGDDYSATIAPSALGPSVAVNSAINFPRLSASVVGIAIYNPGPLQVDNTEFILPSVGVYRVTWHISVDEPAQWSLWISTNGSSTVIVPAGPGGMFSQFKTDPSGMYSPTGTGVASQVGQASLVAQLGGDVVFLNPVAGAAIQIRNYAASPGTVTVTPVPGGTQAQAVSLIIQRLS